MKKIVSCIMAAVLSAGSLPVLSSAAESNTLVYNGLEYTIINDTKLELTGAADKSVTSVTIPESIDGKAVVAGDGIFSDCPELTEINADSKNAELKSVDGVLFSKDGSTLLEYPRGLQGEYSIPEGTASIASGAFENASGLTSVDLPDSLSYVGVYAFRNCTSLTGFSKPVPLVASGEALYGCTALKSVTLADVSEPTDIGNIIFEDCPDLESLIIPDSYILTGTLRLSNCPELKELILPETSGGANIVISSCDSLTSFAAPAHSGTFTSTKAAVGNCSNMTELVFNSANNVVVKEMPSLEVIRYNGFITETDIDFVTCPKLRDIYYNTEKAGSPSAEEAMLMADNDITVHCRKADTQLQTFLSYYNVNYVIIDEERIFGDVNLDSDVNMADAVLIMQSLSNPDRFELTEEQRLNGDVYQNGSGITAMDATTIQRFLLKQHNSLPV